MKNRTMLNRIHFLVASLMCLTAISRAELTNFTVNKRLTYYQDGATLATPQQAAYLDYYFGITGNTNLLSASFAANLATVPMQIQEDDGWRGYVAFSTQAGLTNTYPNLTFYDFTTQLLGDGPRVSRGNFISGAGFPFNTPQVNFYSNTQTISPFTQFQINLTNDAFGPTGSLGPNLILLSVFDPVTLNAVYEQIYAYNDKTLEIPAGTLSANRDYLAHIQFISPDTLTPASGTSRYAVVTRYLSENWLRLRTLGNVTTLTPSINRKWAWSQNGPAALTAESDLDSLQALLPRPAANDVADATFIQIGLHREYAMKEEPAASDYAFSYTLSASELADFTGDLVGVGWKYNSGKTNLEFDNWSLSEPTQGPEILNWDAAQAIVASSEFTLSVQRPDNFSGMVEAELEIRTLAEEVIYSASASAGSTGPIEVTLPPDTLEPDVSYQASLKLTNPQEPGAPLQLNVIHQVSFFLSSTSGTWPGVASAGIYRGTYFDHGTGAVDPAQGASFTVILTEDTPGELESATIERMTPSQLHQPKAQGEYPLSRNSKFPDQWRFVRFYESESTLLTYFPYANYIFRTTLGDEVSTRVLSSTELQSEAPQIILETGYLLDQPDPSLPIPIRWTGFDANAAGASVEVMLGTVSTAAIPLTNLSPDGLGGYLPRNLLSANAEHQLRLVFRRDLEVDDQTFENTKIIQGDEYFTMLTLTTGAANFQAWLEEHFDAEQLADPAISAPEANPDHDAYDNVHEFVLNQNPLAFSAAPSIQDAGAFFLVEFDWRSDTPLLVYELRTSSTLEPPFEVVSVEPSVIPGNPYDKVRFTFPDATPLFVQLVVIYGAP